MSLKILLMIIAAIAANWFLYEQALLTRMAAGIVAALIVALAYDRWLLGIGKRPRAGLRWPN
jgi:uncharacterized membrane protein